MIDKNFIEQPAEKYWSFPSSYSKEKRKEEVSFLIKNNITMGAIKKDGHYFRFSKTDDGDMFLTSRDKSTVTGEFINKIDWVPHLYDFFNSLPNGTVLLGEIYFPNKAGSKEITKIMGCLQPKAVERQKEDSDKVYYYIFDAWAFNGKSLMNTRAEERFNLLKEIDTKGCQFVQVAEYKQGLELWALLWASLEAGEEGIVITNKDSTPAPGKKTARKTLKIKKELTDTIDVFFTGRYKQSKKDYKGKEIESHKYWLNSKTNKFVLGEKYEEFVAGGTYEPVTKGFFMGFAGSLEYAVVDKEGNIIPIGWLSSLTEEIKISVKENPEKIKNKVIEINAMEYEDTGGFRHCKMIQFRQDKNWKDCSIEQIK